MERMALPGVVDELHLAEPLPPLILGFDVFDQAWLGRQGDRILSCARYHSQQVALVKAA
jgi:hypothetical protein